MNILPTTYMGPVEWYRQFLANPSAVQIEVMESFPKQTYRNRCTITVPHDSQSNCQSPIANRLTLTVPVKRVDSKQFTRDVEISYQKRWQHQHWIALVSAYKRTPYFDYYADFFRPFYEQETRFLVDFNEKIHEVIHQLIRNSEFKIQNSKFTTDWSGLDLEPCFGNGQSILDLLFEYGPETIIKLNNTNSIN
ncbi:MAG: WbqC family protein [Paludibacteraceae bacterium]|nr:WbqC family protein [Paludibacteraceae bacterium]MBO5013012.1 WbqC family protein [Paludibacteraceae bacterium]